MLVQDEDVCKAARYCDLVAVDVSDESFQRLTTCQRKVYPTGSGRGKEKMKKGHPTVEPNIMDLYPYTTYVVTVTFVRYCRMSMS